MIPRRHLSLCVIMLFGVLLGGCASTRLIESPRTTYVPESETVGTPDIIWTSRSLTRPFDYLGRVEVRSWTYDGAVERLAEGGKALKADAIIDIHFERVGFMKTMQAFAVKYKNP